jgi:hypothetical protein
MRRAFHPLVLSLVMIALAFLCYELASVFFGQYAHASGIVSHAISEAKSHGDYSGATLVGLPNPGKYKHRVDMMFLASVLVLILSVILAFRRRHWSCWIAVCLAVVGVVMVFDLDSIRF